MPLAGFPQVTTIAGGGTGADASLATNATVVDPSGVLLDAAGNMLIASAYAGTIRRVSAANNSISTLSTSPITLNLPYALALDDAGNLFILEFGSHRITRKPATGASEVWAGSGAAAAGYVNGVGSTARFNYPTDMAMYAYGSLYVTDARNHAIRHIDTFGNVRRSPVLWGAFVVCCVVLCCVVCCAVLCCAVLAPGLVWLRSVVLCASESALLSFVPAPSPATSTNSP
jgi:hypothetical protein